VILDVNAAELPMESLQPRIRTITDSPLSVDKDAPIPRPITPPGDGNIVAIPEVGGLHHRYERRAA